MTRISDLLAAADRACIGTSLGELPRLDTLMRRAAAPLPPPPPGPARRWRASPWRPRFGAWTNRRTSDAMEAPSF